MPGGKQTAGRHWVLLTCAFTALLLSPSFTADAQLTAENGSPASVPSSQLNNPPPSQRSPSDNSPPPSSPPPVNSSPPPQSLAPPPRANPPPPQSLSPPPRDNPPPPQPVASSPPPPAEVASSPPPPAPAQAASPPPPVSASGTTPAVATPSAAKTSPAPGSPSPPPPQQSPPPSPSPQQTESPPPSHPSPQPTPPEPPPPASPVPSTNSNPPLVGSLPSPSPSPPPPTGGGSNGTPTTPPPASSSSAEGRTPGTLSGGPSLDSPPPSHSPPPPTAPPSSSPPPPTSPSTKSPPPLSSNPVTPPPTSSGVGAPTTVTDSPKPSSPAPSYSPTPISPPPTISPPPISPPPLTPSPTSSGNTGVATPGTLSVPDAAPHPPKLSPEPPPLPGSPPTLPPSSPPQNLPSPTSPPNPPAPGRTLTPPPFDPPPTFPHPSPPPTFPTPNPPPTPIPAPINPPPVELSSPPSPSPSPLPSANSPASTPATHSPPSTPGANSSAASAPTSQSPPPNAATSPASAVQGPPPPSSRPPPPPSNSATVVATPGLIASPPKAAVPTSATTPAARPSTAPSPAVISKQPTASAVIFVPPIPRAVAPAPEKIPTGLPSVDGLTAQVPVPAPQIDVSVPSPELPNANGTAPPELAPVSGGPAPDTFEDIVRFPPVATFTASQGPSPVPSPTNISPSQGPAPSPLLESNTTAVAPTPSPGALTPSSEPTAAPILSPVPSPDSAAGSITPAPAPAEFGTGATPSPAPSPEAAGIVPVPSPANTSAPSPTGPNIMHTLAAPSPSVAPAPASAVPSPDDKVAAPFPSPVLAPAPDVFSPGNAQAATAPALAPTPFPSAMSPDPSLLTPAPSLTQTPSPAPALAPSLDYAAAGPYTGSAPGISPDASQGYPVPASEPGPSPSTISPDAAGPLLAPAPVPSPIDLGSATAPKMSELITPAPVPGPLGSPIYAPETSPVLDSGSALRPSYAPANSFGAPSISPQAFSPAASPGSVVGAAGSAPVGSAQGPASGTAFAPVATVTTSSVNGIPSADSPVLSQATSAAARGPVSYAPAPLPLALEQNLAFFTGSALAPSPSVPSWLAGAEQIGTNLYYVGDAVHRGFYTVQSTSNGSVETVAFATVPAGQNTSTYTVLGLQLLMLNCTTYPLNETYQASILNSLHLAFDAVHMPHILQYESQSIVTVNQAPAPASSGRRLAQAASPSADNITASLSVASQQNVQVNLTVAVPFQDRNNVTAIVQDAINSGQVRRGLQESGLQVQNATVTGVNTISTGTNPDLTPSPPANNATPQTGKSGISAGVIAGPVIGAIVAVCLICLTVFWVHRRKARAKEDLEASVAQKMDPSDSMAQIYANGHGRGYPGTIKTGVMKGPDGLLLSNGYSSTESPYAQSVQPMSAQSQYSDTYKALLSVPDNPDWRPYRGFVARAQQNFLNHTPNSEHLLDANVPQVMRLDLKMDKEIGKGSFGKVSIARWRGLTVAVKELKGNSEIGFHTTTPEILKNLQKEASMMASMRHPNVVLFLGICIESPAIITEYCARGSLYEVIQKWNNGKEVANWLRRLGMVLDAAKGMQYLHACNPPLIHRDLKTPNLLVDKNYIVKICDFNLSKVMENSMCNVTSSLASVNPRWQAPEILQEKGYSKASDVYSFGIVLWEMLTWQVPWKDLNTWQIMGMLSHGPDFRPEVPERLEDLPGGTFGGIHDYIQLMRDCWAEHPEDRPDFPAVAEQLRQIMGQEALLRRERSERRNSSLGTEHSNSGLLSFGNSTQPPTTDQESGSDRS